METSIATTEREHRLMRLIDSDCPHDLDEARHLIAQLKTAVRYDTRLATVELIRDGLAKARRLNLSEAVYFMDEDVDAILDHVVESNT